MPTFTSHPIKNLFQLYLIGGFIIVFAFLQIMFYLFYENNKNNNYSTYILTHAKEVLLESELVYSDIEDIESAERAYVLTFNSLFLNHFNVASKTVFVHLGHLSNLTKGEKDYAKITSSISRLIKHRFDLCKERVMLVNNREVEYVHKLVNDGEGEKIMDSIHSEIQLLQNKENYTLTLQEKESYLTQQKSLSLIYVLESSLVIILIGLFILIEYNLIRRKKAEETLILLNNELEDRVKIRTELMEKNEKRFRALVENSYGMISLIDENYNLLFRSHNSSTVNGWTEKERSEIGIYNLIHPDFIEYHKEKMKEVFANPEKQIHFLFPFKHKNGNYIWLEGISVNKFSDPNVKGIITNLHDITERRVAEDKVSELNEELEEKVEKRTAELAAINKELESFTYSVSHDLRTPLRSIDGFARALHEKYYASLNDEAKRYLNIVENNAKRMTRLIEDLLLFSRMGKQNVQKMEIDMNGLVNEVWEEFEKHSETKNRTLIKEHSLPIAFGDAHMIKQVLINLISNAIKYSANKEKSEIKIGAEIKDNHHVYYIKDNGVGFDMAYYRKLFGVFQRLHNQSEFEGTGVGLSIVKRIINKHNGEVLGEGKVDEGATFYFSLPISK